MRGETGHHSGETVAGILNSEAIQAASIQRNKSSRCEMFCQITELQSAFILTTDEDSDVAIFASFLLPCHSFTLSFPLSQRVALS